MKEEFNIFEKLDISHIKYIRKRMIECILSTDMSNHAKNISLLKSKILLIDGSGENLKFNNLLENEDKKFDNQQVIMNNLIHAADISNPAKLSSIYKNWVNLIFQEFFNQGDLERKSNLHISMNCDRNLTDIPKTQIGFIKFIVRPTFEVLRMLSPEIRNYLDYINKNLKMYEDEVNQRENNQVK